METKIMQQIDISQYQAVIFDMDGTLYFQKPFRRKMASAMLMHLIRHPFSIGDMLLVAKYRKEREAWKENAENLEQRQYAYVAQKCGCEPGKVAEAVRFFMYDLPMPLLRANRDDILADVVRELKRKNITTAIYSDYPAEKKLKALGIEVDHVFCAFDREISCMKPDPKGLQVVLQTIKCKPERALMIGDRYEKDGLCAKENGVDYLILEASKKKRKNKTQSLLSSLT